MKHHIFEARESRFCELQKMTVPQIAASMRGWPRPPPGVVRASGWKQQGKVSPVGRTQAETLNAAQNGRGYLEEQPPLPERRPQSRPRPSVAAPRWGLGAAPRPRRWRPTGCSHPASSCPWWASQAARYCSSASACRVSRCWAASATTAPVVSDATSGCSSSSCTAVVPAATSHGSRTYIDAPKRASWRVLHQARHSPHLQLPLQNGHPCTICGQTLRCSLSILNACTSACSQQAGTGVLGESTELGCTEGTAAETDVRREGVDDSSQRGGGVQAPAAAGTLCCRHRRLGRRGQLHVQGLLRLPQGCRLRGGCRCVGGQRDG